jgi:hypothetical protein
MSWAKWIFASKEISNFTYELEDSSKRYLAALISDITGASFNTVAGYIEEIEGDEALRKHVVDRTARSNRAFGADRKALYGRRMGWYAVTRVTKPKIVIETGVDKGLGSCVLTAALKRNNEEGYAGRYYGTDINPEAGFLLSGEYAGYGQILYGDSIQTLCKFDESIDLFINDSDHSADYEAEEYRIVADKLSDKAIILGDNSHCTDKLLEFSLAADRNFIFYHEKPLNHWYPGGGIGFSFRR